MKDADKKLSVGDIVKMKPGYHTSKPYYVEILSVSIGYIKTNIPGEHSLEIHGSNFDYHTKRMTLVGSKSEHGHLIINQKLN